MKANVDEQGQLALENHDGPIDKKVEEEDI